MLAVLGRACAQGYLITNDEPIKFWTFMGNALALYGLPTPTIPLPAGLLLVVAIVVAWILALLRPLVGEVRSTFTPSRVRIMSTHHSYRCDRAKRELGYRPLYSNAEGLQYTRARMPSP